MITPRLFLLPLLACPVFFAGCIKMAPASPSPRVISTSAQATLPVKNAVTSVQLGVVQQGKTVAEVRSALAAQASALAAYLKQAGVDKLTTSEVSLSPRYDYVNGRQVSAGYDASLTVGFEVKPEQAGGVLDGAMANGSNRIISVVSRPSDASLAQARDAATAEATEKAIAQADAVLKSAGLTKVGVSRINADTGYVSPGPRPYAMMKAARADAEAEIPVEGGESTLTATVSVEVEFK